MYLLSASSICLSRPFVDSYPQHRALSRTPNDPFHLHPVSLNSAWASSVPPYLRGPIMSSQRHLASQLNAGLTPSSQPADRQRPGLSWPHTARSAHRRPDRHQQVTSGTGAAYPCIGIDAPQVGEYELGGHQGRASGATNSLRTQHGGLPVQPYIARGHRASADRHAKALGYQARDRCCYSRVPVQVTISGAFRSIEPPRFSDTQTSSNHPEQRGKI